MSKKLLNDEIISKTLEADYGHGCELKSWTIQDFTRKGDNFMSFVTSVKAKFKFNGNDLEKSYVVKLNPFYSSESFQSLIKDSFVKEGKFLSVAVPELSIILKDSGHEPLKIPKAYYFSSENNKEIIILEDLRESGFKMVDRKIGLDNEHVKLVIQELSRLHASSILLQNKHKTNLQKLFPFIEEKWQNSDHPNRIQYKNLFEDYIKNAKSLLDNVPDYKCVSTWLESFQSRVFEECCQKCLNPSKKFGVICHGDCWSNNTLFRYDPDGKPIDVRFVDFQMCRIASSSTDINYLLYSSITGEDRKENLTNYLNLYLHTFNNILKQEKIEPGFTSEEFVTEYHSKNIWGMISGIMIVPLVVLESTESPDISKLTDEEFENYQKEKREKTVKLLKSNIYFKPRFLSIFDDMIEYGIIR